VHGAAHLYRQQGVSVVAIGLNHTTAPLDLRARFALPAPRLGPALQAFSERLKRSAEVAIVSTCNRTELYLSGVREHADSALDWLAELGETDRGTLRSHSYLLEGGSAARHAFRVASGLDSMVLGEPQILGQFKQALREAENAGTLGTTLHQLFQRSFAVAKEVRTQTRIGEHSVSLAAASVRLAAGLFEDLSRTRVLCVGAGEMIELVGLHFAARKPLALTVANRTLERAQALGARLGGDAMALSELPQRLGEFDIVISCTASSLPIIGLGAVESALRARRKRPMFFADLAVPRDVEPEVARLPDAYLYTLDDLAHVVQAGGEMRRAAVRDAEAIIESGVHEFEQWLDQRGTVPLIQALHRQTDDWRHAEIARARRQLARGGSIDEALEALSQGLTRKLMHGALAELHAAEGAQRDELGRTMTRLFLNRRSAR
jgi:glutamyl-tRNA reductase